MKTLNDLSLDGAGVLAQTLREIHRPLAAVAALSLVINVLALTVPIYMTQVYDRVLTSYSLETLAMLTALALGLLAVLVALDGSRSQILTRAILKAEQTLGPPLLEAATRDQLVARVDANLPLRDLAALRAFGTSPVMTAFFDAPLVPLYVMVTFFVHPALGAIALAAVLAMFGCAAANQMATAKRTEEAGKASNALLHGADHQTRNADVIHAMGLMPALRRRWRGAQDKVLEAQIVVNDKGGRYQAALRYVRLALQIVTLGAGAAFVVEGEITAGMMFAVSIILSRGVQPIEVAVGSWRGLLAARGSVARVRDALLRSALPRQAMPLPTPAGRVAVDNVLHVAGAERRQILKGVSFELLPGESLGIIGPAASGKSTLARIVLGVLAPSAGIVRLDGADVGQWPRASLGPHIGYLPQEVELFPGTVADNIARMDVQDPEEVVAAAQWAGAHEMILRLPRGYDTSIMAGGLVLSPGQRQRVALARALYGAPKLLVLDEPNSNLDGEGEAALGAALRHAKTRGITVIVIAHRTGVLRHLDKLLLLHDGAVQAFGGCEEVLAQFARAQRQGETIVPKFAVVRANAGAV
jgi:PrtD family type I secretion system ABC transporter